MTSLRLHGVINVALALIAVVLAILLAMVAMRRPGQASVAPVAPAVAVAVAEPEKYAIASGVYRQAGVSDVRRLVVESNGRGQLVLDFEGLAAIVVGSSRVAIDTTWEVEGEEVVFTLHGGTPEASYGRVLNFALEEVTRFSIAEFGEDALTLVRVPDGEIFRWERVVAP